MAANGTVRVPQHAPRLRAVHNGHASRHTYQEAFEPRQSEETDTARDQRRHHRMPPFMIQKHQVLGSVAEGIDLGKVSIGQNILPHRDLRKRITLCPEWKEKCEGGGHQRHTHACQPDPGPGEDRGGGGRCLGTASMMRRARHLRGLGAAAVMAVRRRSPRVDQTPHMAWDSFVERCTITSWMDDDLMDAPPCRRRTLMSYQYPHVA